MSEILDSNAKTLLVIGNGFDLACGLKSRYADFFEDRFSEAHEFGRIFREQSEVTDAIVVYVNLAKGTKGISNIIYTIVMIVGFSLSFLLGLFV
jgi:hypothetical protein